MNLSPIVLQVSMRRFGTPPYFGTSYTRYLRLTNFKRLQQIE